MNKLFFFLATFMMMATLLCPEEAQAQQPKGREYVEHALQNFQLIRITNRRMNQYSLADDGSRVLCQRTQPTALSQVWILEKEGDGYSLRNGQTGRFLNDDGDFRQPSVGPTTIYIQYSPNNSGTTSWVNFSEKSDFSGKSCLNENDSSPADLYKWECDGDSGSDWTIAEVTNFTKDEILQGLLERSRFAQVKSGHIYRITNMGYGTVIYEQPQAGQVRCQESEEGKMLQYWRVELIGNKCILQNAITGRYIKRQNGSLSQNYITTATRSSQNCGFTLRRTDNATDPTYTITDANNVGLHADAGQNLVGWYTNRDHCEWGFEPVEVDSAELAAACRAYADYRAVQESRSALNEHLEALFLDQACTQLRPQVAALPDDELAHNEHFAALPLPLQEMTAKVKSDAWQTFTSSATGFSAPLEKFFRVAPYRVYSNHEAMAKQEYTSMSNSFGRLSNPTGISGRAGDVVYIFVDGPVSPDCTLAVETVNGAVSTGQQTPLKPGLNAILLSDQANLFIFYELKDPEKYLADYPDINIHIEGGRLNGYFDLTRGMTNAHWKLMQEHLLKESPIVNLKTERLVLCMHTPYVVAAEPNEMEGILSIWNHICYNEQKLMGLEEFEGRLRNVWNAFSMTSGFMHSTVHGTYYHHDCLHTILNYHAMTHQRAGEQGGQIWGPSHEMGHNHQNAINIVGAAEASNNMFSNINVFEQGISTTTYRSPMANFALFNQGKHWHHCGIEIKTRLYFQLYLYFHVMQGDTTFIPRLFKALRADRLQLKSGGYNASLTHGEVKGGYISYGKDDYLHLARKICDVAQADMSEFFEAYGMFVPMDKYYVGDYSDYFVTTTQKDIDDTRAYMQQYPKKIYNIMFIDDHIATNQKAQPSPEWESVPAPDGLKVNGCTYDGAKMGTAGDVGMYWDYSPLYQAHDYYYTMNPYTYQITIRGEGAVGFKVYGEDGRLAWLSNSKTFRLPSRVAKTNFTVVAAEGNGHDVVIPRDNTHPLADVYYPGQAEPRTLFAAPGMQLPPNAVAVIRPKQEYAAEPQTLAIPNVVDSVGHAATLIIDGQQPWHTPLVIQADSVSFAWPAPGYAALRLPFAVSSSDLPALATATCADGRVQIAPATQVSAGAPVVVNGPMQLQLQHVAVQAATYHTQPQATILAPDGTSLQPVEQALPFAFDFSAATALIPVWARPAASEAIYDLQGRRLPAIPTRPGLYIVRGRKQVVR